MWYAASLLARFIFEFSNAINKGGQERWVEFNTWGVKNPGTYHDLIHGHQMQLSGNRFTLYIPPRTAQMWLTD